MWVTIYECVCASIFCLSMYVCVCICVRVCMCIYVYTYQIYIPKFVLYIYIYHKRIPKCICFDPELYTYVYIYIHTYIHTYRLYQGPKFWYQRHTSSTFLRRAQTAGLCKCTPSAGKYTQRECVNMCSMYVYVKYTRK